MKTLTWFLQQLWKFHLTLHGVLHYTLLVWRESHSTCSQQCTGEVCSLVVDYGNLKSCSKIALFTVTCLMLCQALLILRYNMLHLCANFTHFTLYRNSQTYEKDALNTGHKLKIQKEVEYISSTRLGGFR